MAQMRLVLTGVRKNWSGVLNAKEFRNGVATVGGTAAELEMCARYFSRTYSAYPDGSDELKAAQAADEARAPKAAKKEEADGVQHPPAPVAGPGNPEGLSGNEPGSTGTVPGADSVPGVGHDPAKSPAGDSGLGADRSGPEHTGLHADKVAKLVKALAALDHKVDAHWTEAGLPSIEVISAAISDLDVTRKMIEVIAPDLTREKLADKVAETSDL